MTPLDPFTALRLRRGAEHLHCLGPRAVAGLLAEVGRDHECLADIIRRTDQWRARLSPEMLRAVGCDRFPPPALQPVPLA